MKTIKKRIIPKMTIVSCLFFMSLGYLGQSQPPCDNGLVNITGSHVWEYNTSQEFYYYDGSYHNNVVWSVTGAGGFIISQSVFAGNMYMVSVGWITPNHPNPITGTLTFQSDSACEDYIISLTRCTGQYGPCY